MSGAIAASNPDAILDDPYLNRRYFFPRRTWFPSPLRVDVEGATLACSFHRARDGAPAVVHFHGNGEVVADYLDGFPERFTASGWNLLLAEYRGYGLSTGEPSLARMLGDVDAIVRAAGAPPERVVAFGRSVGSIFAIEAARRFPLAGLVLESAVADPRERLLLRLSPRELGVSDDAFAAACAERLDHRRKLAGYPGPVLVLHALFDDLVPVTHGERLAEWAAGPVIPRFLDRGDHNSILAENERAYFEALAELVALAGGSPRGEP